MTLTHLPLESYPAINFVTAIFDCAVIQRTACDDQDRPDGDLFSLGAVSTPESDTDKTEYSPVFRSLQDLENFCATHMVKYEKVAEAMERTSQMPSKWFWEVESAPNPEWEQYGETIGGSRWFNGTPKIVLDENNHLVWKCPTTDCEGDMHDTGAIWPTGEPVYHHECTLCGFTAAIKGAVFWPAK